MHDKPKVIIIGAGFAGLAAAKKLLNHCNVTVLEARDRIGGRTWTDHSLGVPFDLGAFIIHGITDNPMTELAQQAHARIVPIDLYKVLFANKDETVSSDQLIAIDEQFSELLESATQYAQAAKKDMPLTEAMQAVFDAEKYPLLTKEFYAWRTLFLSLYSGADAKYLSAQNWNKDETILEGGHHFMLDGYKPLITDLAKDVPIVLNTKVTKIHYANDEIEITTTNGSYPADAVIVTVPLGVLKKGAIDFQPAMPEIKQQALARVKMGLLNKVALRFPHVFWPKEYRLICRLAEKYSTAAWFINYDYLFQQPVLLATIAGDMARDFENYSDEKICEILMTELRKLFGNDIPNPTGYSITRWAQDPYAYGSYAYIPVGASADDFDVLSQPIADKIYFAGEATHKNLSATTHGAYLSGIREAVRVLKRFLHLE